MFSFLIIYFIKKIRKRKNMFFIFIHNQVWASPLISDHNLVYFEELLEISILYIFFPRQFLQIIDFSNILMHWYACITKHTQQRALSLTYTISHMPFFKCQLYKLATSNSISCVSIIWLGIVNHIHKSDINLYAHVLALKCNEKYLKC